MEILGLGLGALMVMLAVAVLVGGLFMFFGARMAGVRHATFGKSCLAALAGNVISFVIGAAFSVVPVLGTIAGFLLGLLLSVLIIKAVFDINFAKALLVWVCNLIAVFLAVLVAVMLAGGMTAL